MAGYKQELKLREYFETMDPGNRGILYDAGIEDPASEEQVQFAFVNFLLGQKGMTPAKIEALMKKDAKEKGNANEAGTKGIANMTQSAGAARLTGAKAILDAINENGQKFRDRMVNQARGEQYVAAQEAERVRETSFNSLFREKYDNIKQAGESGAHRRAAKEALTRIKAQKAAEDAAAAAQQAGQQMENDVNGRQAGPMNRQ